MTPFTDIPLTPKQQRFCDEYLIDMNATAAALRAGYSPATALSGQLMVVPKIMAQIKARTEKVSHELQVSHEMIVAELAKTAFANLGDLFGADGKIRPMHEISDKDKAALWSISISEDKDGGTTVKLRLNNKMTALEKLAKHTGFYKVGPKVPDPNFVYLTRNDLFEYDRIDDDHFDEADKLWEDELRDNITALKEQTAMYMAREQELKTQQEELDKQKNELEERERELEEEAEELDQLREELNERAQRPPVAEVTVAVAGKAKDEEKRPEEKKPEEERKGYHEPIGFHREQALNQARAVKKTHYMGTRLYDL